MFLNILAEMARRQISKHEMANYLGISVWTLDRKIKNITGFTVNEITAIQKIFNNKDCTFEYLFKKE